MNRFGACAAVLVVSLAAPAATPAQDFYEGQLVAGKVAHAAKNWVEAADAFRIAAFGFLDRPGLLLESLAYLALTQAAMGQTDASNQTVERWIEIEARFPSWRSHAMDASVRGEFETLLRQRIPESRLLAIASLEGLVETEEEKLAALPPRERKRRLEQLVRSDGENATWPAMLGELAWSERNRREAIRWSARALELDPSRRSARVVLARALLADRSCEEALVTIAQLGGLPDDDQIADHFLCLVELKELQRAGEMIPRIPDALKTRRDVRVAIQRVDDAREIVRAETPARPETARREEIARREPERPPQTVETPAQALARVTTALREGQRLITGGRYPEAAQLFGAALERDPGSRELRLALLEASTLARDFRTAVAQVPLVSPIRDTEPRFLFYAAVARYESGDHDEARRLMAQARPRLAPSPYVDDYLRKILGE